MQTLFNPFAILINLLCVVLIHLGIWHIQLKYTHTVRTEKRFQRPQKTASHCVFLSYSCLLIHVQVLLPWWWITPRCFLTCQLGSTAFLLAQGKSIRCKADIPFLFAMKTGQLWGGDTPFTAARRRCTTLYSQTAASVSAHELQQLEKGDRLFIKWLFIRGHCVLSDISRLGWK